MAIVLGMLTSHSMMAGTTAVVKKGESVGKSRLNELNLTDAQRKKWNEIFQKYKQKAIELQHQQSAEVNAILTPRQREIIKEENERRAALLTKKIMQDEMERRKADEKSGSKSNVPVKPGK